MSNTEPEVKTKKRSNLPVEFIVGGSVTLFVTWALDTFTKILVSVGHIAGVIAIVVGAVLFLGGRAVRKN